MATSDVKILESRLLTRDSAIGGSTVTKCALRLQQLYEEVRKGEKGDVKTSLEAFSRDVMLYKVEMGKYDLALSMLDQEAVEYDKLEDEIAGKINKTTDAIVTLTQELVQQKKLKKHREECEALARIVNLVPSTRTLMASSNVVNDEICRLKEQLASVEATEKLRSRQVNLLLQSIADLSKSLEEEDTLQKNLQMLQQSVDNQIQDDEDGNDENDDDIDNEDESRDKRSERGKDLKRKKSSGNGDEELDEGDSENQQRSDGDGDDSERKTKKLKTAIVEELEEGEAEEIASVNDDQINHGENRVSASPINGVSSPTPMTIKEKLQQQQLKRAQKMLEKEKEMSKGNGEVKVTLATTLTGSSLTTETEEGEEQEDPMDTSA